MTNIMRRGKGAVWFGKAPARRRPRRWAAGFVGLLGCVAPSCGGQENNQPPAEAISRTASAFNSSYFNMGIGSGPRYSLTQGHELITRKAMDYLAKRGLLSPLYTRTDFPFVGPNWNLVVYGNWFADHPWAGPPELPTQATPNRMTALAPRGVSQSTQAFSYKFTVENWFDATMNATAYVSTQWKKGTQDPFSTTMNYTLDLTTAPSLPAGWVLTLGWSLPVLGDGLRLAFGDQNGSPPSETTREEFAVDNFLHYALGDIAHMPLPPTCSAPRDTSLRLYPLTDTDLAKDQQEYDSWSAPKRDAINKLVPEMINQELLAGADFGVTTYGAVLYQVARKFFEDSRAEPDLAELVKVGNDISSRHTGHMQGHGKIGQMSMAMPHTYLGGMPHVCSGSTAADPCATGSPTWPHWVNLESLNGGVDLSKREIPKPGRSLRAGLIYLGWATHMMQDASAPHHAANWTGKQHQLQDTLADNVDYYTDTYCDPISGDCLPAPWQSMENYQPMIDQVNALLGPEGAPRSRKEICRSVGVGETEVLPGTLNWKAVQPLFNENAQLAYCSRREAIPPTSSPNDENSPQSVGREYVKNALLGTIKLLLCATPDTNPALWGENNKDFNNDVNTDILWHNTVTGDLFTWLMNGTDVADVQDPGYDTPVSSGWYVKGTGDFNHDGKTDILWQNPDAGQIGLWLMSGASVLEMPPLVQNGMYPGWDVVGTGDFNADGQIDILLYNLLDGRAWVLFMNGTTSVAQSQLGPTIPPSWGWRIKGTGDFNHDGKIDVLWQHGESGTVQAWLMNGTNLVSTADLPWVVPASSGWQLDGTGDFNRDGHTDLLWRQPELGYVGYWYLNGTNIIANPVAGWPVFGTDWQIVSR